MKTIDITALGELLIDFTETGLSPQGNRLLEVNPGGAPCNVLAMLAGLGRNTCFIGKVGQDMFGDLLEDAVRSVGIDTRGLNKDAKTNTTLAFVHTKEGGDREFSFYRNPGADMMLQESDLDPELISQARIFHFGSLSMTHPGCREATRKAITLAEEAGCILSFDPNLREPLWNSLEEAHEQIDYGMKHCQVLKISDNEIQWFTGEEDFRKGIDILKTTYHIPLILLSLGRNGSIAASSRDQVFVPAFINPATIETTGAGDTFCACVLHEVLRQQERRFGSSEGYDPEKHASLWEMDAPCLKEMLTFANAAASIVTTKKGALKVMPHESEVREFIALQNPV